jgi:two-component system response regulator MtrA
MAMKATILCVDDEPAVLFSTRAILMQAGYDVLAAATVDAGMACLRERPIDLVLLDSLPDHGQLIAAARHANQAVKLLLCTGDPSKGEAPAVDAIICKPAAPPELLRLIAELLRDSAAPSEPPHPNLK